jgi:hypothetical protein
MGRLLPLMGFLFSSYCTIVTTVGLSSSAFVSHSPIAELITKSGHEPSYMAEKRQELRQTTFHHFV